MSFASFPSYNLSFIFIDNVYEEKLRFKQLSEQIDDSVLSNELVWNTNKMFLLQVQDYS